ncbi:MAG: class I adenylate-forming enzyme family protein [Candidatus Acidiferrum sp.]|jgi:acyl-CoA synthetase (AMP-forming)/AMP-acid ligase II
MSIPDNLPSLTPKDFEERFGDRHLLHGIVEKWALEKPSAIALIDADRKQEVSWAAFDRMATGLAMRLLECGFRKGECFATLLPLLSEHVFLEYACFKIGVIFVPLDLRLLTAEVLRSLALVNAKGFAFTKVPGGIDPATLANEIRSRAPLRTLLQFSPGEECVEGATPAASLLQDAMRLCDPVSTGAQGKDFAAKYNAARQSVSENDGALVIFTTGSTGSPKPALLSHRNISCQAMCISQALLRSDKGLVTLVNLPASHVGCQTELLAGTLFEGGTAVLLPVFDPLRSLQAVEEYKVTVVGQIPAMFQFEWRLKDYDSFDLSSLEFVAYGGQQVSAAFIEKMATMAPSVGTGLGLTETAGFCTYIRRERARAGECVSSLGWAMPVYPTTIRHPMRADGSAGDELPDGEPGHVCFSGPQTFLGYINDPASMAATLSKDGYLYTGDIGFRDPGGLHLAGRAKWVIKPGGYQVFPGDVENHFCALEQVASCAAVGVEHAIISEAIVAFVEKKPGAELTMQMLEKHARGLASYMRPRHYVLLDAGKMPLNRASKANYLVLQDLAKREVEALRSTGLWDRSDE